jgi:hypothetical protein
VITLTQIIQKLSNAASSLLGVDWVYQELVTAEFLVVRDPKDSTNYIRFDYTLDADHNVTLGTKQAVTLTTEPARMIEAVRDGEAKAADRFEIRILREGLSKNGIHYGKKLMRESVALFDGVPIYALSDAEHNGPLSSKKDVRNKIGVIKNPRFVESELGCEIRGTAVILPSTGWAGRFSEAITADVADMYGFSIDATGDQAKKGRFIEATKFTKVNSVDVVDAPGAGGQLIRFTEATHEDSHVPNAVQPENTTAPVEAPSQPDYVKLANDGMRMVEAKMYAATAVTAAALPQPAKDRLMTRFTEATQLDRATVDAQITAEVDYLKAIVPGPAASNGGRITESVVAGDDYSDKMFQRFVDLFDTKKPAASFREAYVDMTGDTAVTGVLANCDLRRFTEASARFTEAVSSTTLPVIFGNAMSTILQRDYGSENRYEGWRDICTVTPLANFKSQKRPIFGGYSDLAVVAENAAFPALSVPTEESQSYAPDTRGGMETISRRALLNDDILALRRIPSRIAVTAKRTLFKFVMNLLRNNVVLDDTVALFHSSRGNITVNPFSASEYVLMFNRMMLAAQRDNAEPIELQLSHLFIPIQLQEAVFNAFALGNNNDDTFARKVRPMIHTVPYWTDANNWYGVASPADIDLIEIGFIGGQEEPVLLAQDSPTEGLMFTNDQMRWKVRHEYGGNVLDWRGFQGGIVP